MLLSETYQRPLTAEMVSGYVEALGDLSEIEVQIGFSGAMRRSKFMPNPAEIREALAAAKDKSPTRPAEANQRCKTCDGTGFKTIPATDRKTGEELPGYKYATKCDCRP